MKTTYKMTIEPLTAVHIGSGETLTQMDYYLKEYQGRELMFVPAQDEVIRRLVRDRVERDQNPEVDLPQGLIQLRDFFKRNMNLRNRDELRYFCIPTEEFSVFYDKAINSRQQSKVLQILQMYRPAGKKGVVIPGSSIKGALRTVFANSYILSGWTEAEYQAKLEEVNKSREGRPSDARLSRRDDQWLVNKIGKAIEKSFDSVFYPNNPEGYKTSAQKDIFRSVSVSDTSFGNRDNQYVGCFHNIKPEDYGTGFKSVGFNINAEFLIGSLLSETVAPGVSSLIIDDDIHKILPFNGDRSSDPLAILIRSANLTSRKTFDEEYQKFYEGEKHIDIIDELKKIIESMTDSENSCVVRLGKFSQIENVSYRENFRIIEHQKGAGATRTVLNWKGNYVPMGWVRMTFERE